ncbi:hypothetical protein ACW0JT_16860 [Arthrobacter sp. SA17]
MSLLGGKSQTRTDTGKSPVSGGLARYVLAATLARSADGGAVVAIVLLVTTSGAPGGWPESLVRASPPRISLVPSLPGLWIPPVMVGR